MKLYLWEHALQVWNSGIAFALANSVEEARQLILDKYRAEGNYRPEVFNTPAGFYVEGSD